MNPQQLNTDSQKQLLKILISVYTGWFKEIIVENKRIYCSNSIFSGPV